MKTVATIRGKHFLVDDEDYDRVLSAGPWYFRLGYACTPACGPMHRFILGYSGPDIVHHLDEDRGNNQKHNLRIVTSWEHAMLHLQKRAGGTSPYFGVSKTSAYQSKPWVAKFVHQRVVRVLGNFSSEVEAALAYDRAVLELRGEYAKPNFDFLT